MSEALCKARSEETEKGKQVRPAPLLCRKVLLTAPKSNFKALRGTNCTVEVHSGTKLISAKVRMNSLRLSQRHLRPKCSSIIV